MEEPEASANVQLEEGPPKEAALQLNGYQVEAEGDLPGEDDEQRPERPKKTKNSATSHMLLCLCC